MTAPPWPPFGSGIQAAAAYLRSRTTRNPKYIVLATDGAPNCDELMKSVGALQAIRQAADAGLHTFVVGINLAAAETPMLDMMAAAGREPRAGKPRYYAAENRQELADALLLIAGRIASCTFTLASPPPSPDDVAVTIDGKAVPRDPARADGWDYAGAANSAIQIHGPACEALKAGNAASVQLLFGCPVIRIP